MKLLSGSETRCEASVSVVSEFRDAWRERLMSDCLLSSDIEPRKKVLARDYKPSGKFPIVDQGQELIAGWTDDNSPVITNALPLVVFGDHTRVFKFVDFPFAIGADGTKLLKPIAEIDPKFFYFACLSLDIPTRGYNRHFKILREQLIRYPELPEQRRIAAVLWKIQRAVEIEEAILRNARDLKKSLLCQLFTHGLRGEPLKETEIGMLPQSWDTIRLGELIEITHGYGFKSEFFRENGAIVLTPGNFKLDGGLYWGRNTKFTSENCREDFRFHAGDLVVVMTDLTPSAKLLGNPAFIPADKVILHNQRIGKVVLNSDRVTKDFLYWLFLTQPFKTHMFETATGSTVRHTSPNRIKSFVCPLPSSDEQGEIADTLRTVDRKIDIHESKKRSLQELFKTTLHKLMTAQIRVNDLEIDTSEVSAG